MKECKLIIDGKEIVCQISDEQIKQFTEQKSQTGYERVANKDIYYTISRGEAIEEEEIRYEVDDTNYEIANYYNDKTLAENDARFYKLHRQLKRFAVENRKKELCWGNEKVNFYIYYDHNFSEIFVDRCGCVKNMGQIYFDNKKIAEKAIELFYDELIWYFTKYKDSL